MRKRSQEKYHLTHHILSCLNGDTLGITERKRERTRSPSGHFALFETNRMRWAAGTALRMLSGTRELLKNTYTSALSKQWYMLLPRKDRAFQDVVMTEAELVAAEIALLQLHLIAAREDGDNEGAVEAIRQLHSHRQTSVFKPS